LTRIGSSGLAGIVAIAFVGLLLNAGLRIIEQRLLFWHYRARLEES
jgi:ABC-type nitrate/sulfonate/bicarbonate transport system permease component